MMPSRRVEMSDLMPVAGVSSRMDCASQSGGDRLNSARGVLEL